MSIIQDLQNLNEYKVVQKKRDQEKNSRDIVNQALDEILKNIKGWKFDSNKYTPMVRVSSNSSWGEYYLDLYCPKLKGLRVTFSYFCVEPGSFEPTRDRWAYNVSTSVEEARFDNKVIRKRSGGKDLLPPDWVKTKHTKELDYDLRQEVINLFKPEGELHQLAKKKVDSEVGKILNSRTFKQAVREKGETLDTTPYVGLSTAAKPSVQLKTPGDIPFDEQVRRVKSSCDNVKYIDGYFDFYGKFIDTSAEMAKYGLPIPGAMIYSTRHYVTVEKLKNGSIFAPEYKDLCKNRKVRRFRDWFQTDVDGEAAVACIFVDGQTAREIGLKPIKEFKDINLADAKLGVNVLLNKEVYFIKESSDTKVTLINSNNSLDVEVPNPVSLVMYEGVPYILESINDEEAILIDEDNQIRARLSDIEAY